MPLFVSNESMDALASKARQVGYQEGYSDGQKWGEQFAQAQCLELGFRFRVAFEVDLNQPQLMPQPANFTELLNQLLRLVKEAKLRWEALEQKLGAYQRDYNQETWKKLSDSLLHSQDKEKGLVKELLDARSQVNSTLRYTQHLEMKIRSLEMKIHEQDRVIAGLQNTLDRANKQGK